MTPKDRFKTRETTCGCGEGEFHFYTVQYDGWSFLHNPDVEWYEMEIECANCCAAYGGTRLRIDEKETPPSL